jgi:hypothetical protein
MPKQSELLFEVLKGVFIEHSSRDRSFIKVENLWSILQIQYPLI